MNVSLTPELEKLVEKKVSTGLYNSASEVVREALRLLQEQDLMREMRLEELRKDIEIGRKELEQGKGINRAQVAARIQKKLNEIKTRKNGKSG